MELNREQCPLCGTELSGVKFKEIQMKLRLEEQEKTAALTHAESTLRLRLEQQFNQDLERQRQALEKKVRNEAEVRIKEVASERDIAAKKLKEAEAREVEIRKQAQQEIAKEKLIAQSQAKGEADQQIKQAAAERDELAKKLKEAQQREVETQKKVEQEIEKQKQAAEIKAKSEAADQINRLAKERDQAAAKAKEAEAREAAASKQIMEDAEKERLSQRQTLETDKKLALLKQQSEFNRERESFQAKLQLVEKQLQKKTANELGDGAEIDLYEALRESFPTDKITRIPKGQAGADILHEILYKGDSCGRIIIDSKNRQGWQNAFVTKLRQDQIDAGAEHAILATTVFPAGKKEMCIESDVIVIAPARVAYITQLLRNAMVTMHVKGLSMKEKSSKMSRLYKLITSESYSRKFTEAGKLAEEILELDVQEMKTHNNVWKKRGSLAKRVQNVLREAETEIAAVIESTDDLEIPPTFGVKSAHGLSVTSRTQGVG